MKDHVVFFAHGKGGSADEAENYRKYIPDADIYGFDYKANLPWDAKKEFSEKIGELKAEYERITVVATSLGAWFTLIAGVEDVVSRAIFISPVVNMERLILDMIGWAGTTEEELQEKKIIPVDFGDDLSWEYLTWVREHPIHWDVPTAILYGSLDNLQSLESMQSFSAQTGAELTVLEGSEHWIHTPDQLAFMDKWLERVTKG